MTAWGKPLLWAILPWFLLAPPLLWQGTRFAQQLADAERTRTQNILELHAGALQRSFDRIEARLDSLTAFVSAQVAVGKEIDAGQFNTFAEGLHASATWIRAFQVVSNGIITHTYPVKGNEAVISYNLLADPRPALGNDVLRAQRTGRVTITGPIELVQGGLGILIRKPLARTNGAPALLAAIILNIAPLLDESGLSPNPGNDLQLALRRESGEIFFGSPTVFKHQPVTRRIALPDGAWEIAGCPLNGWQPAFSQPVLLFYAGGFAGVFLLSTLFLVLARSRANLSQTVRERTEALRDELAARQHSQEQFRLIMENLTDMVAVLDLSGRRIYNSPSYGKILRDPGQLVGTSSFAEIHPDDRSRVEQIFQDTARSGVGHRLQYRMVDRNGEARHIESQGSVIREDSSQVAQVVVVSRDVTERQRMEEALRESERQLSLILNNVSDVIFAVAVEANGNFRFTSANRRFLEATGLPESQIVGAFVRDIIPEPAQVTVFQKYREAIQTRQPVRWEEVSDYPAGRKVGHITVVPVFDAHGICTQLVGMVHDHRTQASRGRDSARTRFLRRRAQ
jgi:PAS domain S-box-containing protein